MGKIPIELGIARPNPKKKRTRSGSSVSSLTKSLKNKIFERDNYTCQCCGFFAEKHQDILFLDRDKKNFDEKNLATVCTFCHQCFNLQDVSEMRSGVLVWLPEIPQTDLNNLARAIYIARISQGGLAETARKVLDTIMARKDEAKRRLSTDDPALLAKIMLEYLPYKEYHMRSKKLAGLRLFPLDRRIRHENGLEFNQFPQILSYWRSKKGPFDGKVPQTWMQYYRELRYKPKSRDAA